MSPLKDTDHLKNKPQRVTRTVFAQSCGSYKTESIYSGVKEAVVNPAAEGTYIHINIYLNRGDYS